MKLYQITRYDISRVFLVFAPTPKQAQKIVEKSYGPAAIGERIINIRIKEGIVLDYRR